MIIYWQLFSVFFKIGLFSFGGGLAMIAFIQQEIISRNWLTPAEFAQIVTISQMTPGPIAVNAATFVGARVCDSSPLASFFGSLIATLGVSLPSFILILLVAGSLKKFSNSLTVKAVLHGIRPAVIGFLLAAVVVFIKLAIFPLLPDSVQGNFHPSGLLLICFLFYLHYYRKLAPISLIMLAGILGLVLY